MEYRETKPFSAGETHVRGVIKRQNGSVRLQVYEKEINGKKEIVAVKYYDELGNDVSHDPILAYQDLPEDARKLLRF